MELGNGVDSKSVTSGRWSKAGIALFSGSGLALLCIMALSTSEPTHSLTSPAESTSLVALSPFRASVGPGMMNTRVSSVLPGSGPFKELALAALQSNSLRNSGRDVSMMATQARDILSTMDPNDKAIVVKAEEAVAKLDPKEMSGITAPLGFFDPLGFSADCSAGRLLFFREVELKHGRVGMLASAGILVAEKFHPLFGGDIDAPAYIAFQQTPLQKFWVAVAIAIAIPEFASIKTFADKEKATDEIFTMKQDREAGDLGWDPLGMKPKTAQAFKELQTKEINNGRLAMLAAAGMIAQECVTGQKVL